MEEAGSSKSEFSNAGTQTKHRSWKIYDSTQMYKNNLLGVLSMCKYYLDHRKAGLDLPLRFQLVEAPTLLDNQHMKEPRLSNLRTSRLYPSGDTPHTHLW